MSIPQNEQHLRVLVVEDEAPVRLSLSAFLRDRNFIVTDAENGQIALGILEKEPIDIIISDIRMPILDGLGLLKEVEKKHPEIKVILVTGYQDIESAIAAARHGALDYVTKPYNLAEIYQILRRVMDTRRRQTASAMEQIAAVRH